MKAVSLLGFRLNQVEMDVDGPQQTVHMPNCDGVIDKQVGLILKNV